MCDPCFRFFIGEKTACVACAHELATRRARRASLGVLVLLAGAYGGAVTFTRAEEQVGTAVGAGLVVLSAVLGYLIARTGRFFDASLAVTSRDERAVLEEEARSTARATWRSRSSSPWRMRS